MADTYEGMENFERAEKLRLKNFEALKQENSIENKQTQLVLKNLIDLFKKWGNSEKEYNFSQMIVKNNKN